jgi:hypothetical protein
MARMAVQGVGVCVLLLHRAIWGDTGVTLATFLLSVVGVALVVLLSVAIALLMEVRDDVRTLLAQGSQRRRWVKEEHED